MKTFLAVFFGVLAAVAVIVIVSRMAARSERDRQAEDLTRTTMMLADGCRAASLQQLSLIRAQLERDEQLIIQARGWQNYSPENDLHKAALHNQFVTRGCFRN